MHSATPVGAVHAQPAVEAVLGVVGVAVNVGSAGAAVCRV
jgi:hypothetical protein